MFRIEREEEHTRNRSEIFCFKATQFHFPIYGMEKFFAGDSCISLHFHYHNFTGATTMQDMYTL